MSTIDFYFRVLATASAVERPKSIVLSTTLKAVTFGRSFISCTPTDGALELYYCSLKANNIAARGENVCTTSLA